jgi:hypothetical protein
MGLTAAALGHLLAARHDEAFAADLLEQTLVQLRAMAGDPLTAPKRVTYLLDVALASNFLGQIRLGLGDHQQAAELFTDGLAAAPRRLGPVHHPRLALRPGAVQPGPRRPGAGGRRGRQAAAVSWSSRPFQSHSRYRQTMRPSATRYMSTQS